MGLEFGQRALLIGPHEARVASHVGRKDGGQTPFNTRVGHIHYLRGLHIKLTVGSEACLSKAMSGMGQSRPNSAFAFELAFTSTSDISLHRTK